MRVRIVTSVLGLALAAGCSGGGGAASGPSWARQSGVFSARVRIAPLYPGARRSAGPPQRILVDTATGEFRIAAGAVGAGGHFVYVSDGHTATQEWGSATHPVVTEYDGSRSFLTGQVGRIPLQVIRGFLAGSAPPSGVRLRVVSEGPPATLVATTATERLRITIGRARHVAAGAFRTARGKRAQVVRELHPGARPNGPTPAYWLGPAWNGHAARSSSAASGHGGWYAVAYPHLAIDVTAPERGLSGDKAVTLEDGTRATLQVASADAHGSFSISSSSGNSTFGDIIFATSSPDPGKTMAFVFVPNAMITLSGTAVTPRSAAAIARSLRPL
jgi:hypothetical protein